MPNDFALRRPDHKSLLHDPEIANKSHLIGKYAIES